MKELLILINEKLDRQANDIAVIKATLNEPITVSISDINRRVYIGELDKEIAPYGIQTETSPTPLPCSEPPK